MKRALGIVCVLAACSSKPAAVVPGEAPPAEGAAAAPATWELDGHRVVVTPPVEFRAGSAELGAEAEAGLEAIRGYLEEKSAISMLRIEGHVVGDGAQRLSEQRAMAVARWLVARGVACERLVPVGFGEHKPAYGDERDTRIELVNAALRGRAIGGMPVDGDGAVAGDPCR
jgi:OOP family OmpA-OmpF porin